MKKQIYFLFLIGIFFALSANNKAFAQYTNYLTAADAASIYCTPAIPLTCTVTADAKHPIAGQTYTYSVTVDPISPAPTIHWFVTDNAQVIDDINALTTDIDAIDGDYVLAAGTVTGNADYNDPTNTINTIDISWKSFSPTQLVLLVTYVKSNDGCTDNVEVYRIQPTFAFIVDIASILQNGTQGDEDCVSPVESAFYDAANDNLNVDYGENWIFFVVNAANFLNSWKLVVNTVYTGAGTVSAVQWAYPADALANTNWNDITVEIEPQNGTDAVGATGECIVLRVRVDHGTDEIDQDNGSESLTMQVKGRMYDEVANDWPVANSDLNEPLTAGGPCDNTLFNEAIFTLNPRTALTSTTLATPAAGTLPFEDKN